MLTNTNTLNTITDIFWNHYSSIAIDCIIGLGKAGIILAPNLSLKLNCNSSYIISTWENSSSVPPEKVSSVMDNAKNVLVLLDVFSTGTVTRQGIGEIKKNNPDLENIYIGSVFCTNIYEKEKIQKEDKVREMFSINDDSQFKTYTQKEFKDSEDLRKEFKLLPLRKK